MDREGADHNERKGEMHLTEGKREERVHLKGVEQTDRDLHERRSDEQGDRRALDRVGDGAHWRGLEQGGVDGV